MLFVVKKKFPIVPESIEITKLKISLFRMRAEIQTVHECRVRLTALTLGNQKAVCLFVCFFSGILKRCLKPTGTNEMLISIVSNLN